VEEVVVGGGGLKEEAIGEDEEATKVSVNDDVAETGDSVADTATELTVEMAGELPTAPAIVADEGGAPTVDETDAPHALAITESQLPSAVFWITVPQGPVPIMRPGYPHLAEHTSTQFFCCQCFLAQAGPADP